MADQQIILTMNAKRSPMLCLHGTEISLIEFHYDPAVPRGTVEIRSKAGVLLGRITNIGEAT